MRRNPARALRTGLGAALLLAAAAAPALAHGALRRSTPAAGARVTTPLSTVTLEFTEAVEARFVRIVLRDSVGLVIERPTIDLSADRKTVTVRDTALAVLRGTVELHWTITGADGHPVEGRLRFFVDAPAPMDSTPPSVDTSALAPERYGSQPVAAGGGSSTAAWGRVDGPAAWVIRWLQYVALLAVVGGWAALVLVLPRARQQLAVGATADTLDLIERRTLRVGTVAAATLAAALVLRFLAQCSALGVSDAAGLRDVLVATNVGRGLIVTMVGALFSLTLSRQGRAPAAAIGVAVGLLGIGAAAMGHAMAATSAAVAVGTGALHVIGAGAWIGTLSWLVVVALPALRADGALRAVVVRAFSAVALVAVAVVGLSGAANAWRYVGSFDALVHSDYGRMLIAKVAVLSAVALTGLYNWRAVVPRVGSVAGGSRLRASAAVELVVALIVLAVTAGLVVLPPVGLSGL